MDDLLTIQFCFKQLKGLEEKVQRNGFVLQFQVIERARRKGSKEWTGPVDLTFLLQVIERSQRNGLGLQEHVNHTFLLEGPKEWIR